MRMTTFLAGAAAGAAAVMYINRSNKSVRVNFSQIGNNVSKALDKAMFAMADKKLGDFNNKHGDSTDEADAADIASSLSKVEELASKDSKVKEEIDQILSNNHVTHPSVTAAADSHNSNANLVSTH